MVDNKVIMNQDKIANTFNKDFLSTANSIISDNNKHISSGTINPITYLVNIFSRSFTKMSWQYASTYEIEKIMKSLKTKNSSGYDEISNRIIKLSTPFIISPLTHTCNTVLNTGVFADRLKFAIVKPLCKKGKIQEISNYRPISLMTSSSKIIEKLVYARLVTHIEANNILGHDNMDLGGHTPQRRRLLLH
jgi:hypothetical protein